MKKLILIISCWMACLASCYANTKQTFLEKEKNAFKQIDPTFARNFSSVYDENKGFSWVDMQQLFNRNTQIDKWETFFSTLDSLYKDFPKGKEIAGLKDETRIAFLNILKQQIFEKKPSTKASPSAPVQSTVSTPKSDTIAEFALLQAFGILKNNYKDFYDSSGLKYDTILKSLSIVDCYSNDISRIQAIDKLEKVYHSNQSKKTKLDAFKIGYQSERRNKKRIGGAVLLTVILVVTVWFIAEYLKNKKKERKADTPDKSLPPVVGNGGATTVGSGGTTTVSSDGTTTGGNGGTTSRGNGETTTTGSSGRTTTGGSAVPTNGGSGRTTTGGSGGPTNGGSAVPTTDIVVPLPTVVGKLFRYAANPNDNLFRAERLSEDKNPDSSNFQIIYEIEKNSDGTIKKSNEGTYDLIEERKEYIATNKKDILLENIAKKDGSVLGKTIVKVIPGRVTRVTRKDKDGNDKDDWEIDPNKLLHIYFG